VDEWLAARPGVLALPREERLARLQELAAEVMRRIAAIMPVTTVALAATALLRHDGDTIDRPRWESIIEELRAALRAAGADVVGDEKTSAEVLDRALVMFTLRRVVAARDGVFHVDRAQDGLLRYYANSIAHFFEPGAAEAAG
jgi:glycerol-3-phosphate O-acyltransferase